MSRFTSASVERVKDAADIVEIVGAHTDLRRAGERYTGLCPFHEERTPSFSVDAREKLYYCFGCEAGGDVFRFVQEKEGVSFPDAVERLAERYGVELEHEREDPRAAEARKRRGRLKQVLERTVTFYQAYLWDSKEAGKARAYLTSRGLGEEVLREFGVGYAPSAWDQVLTRGQQAGFSVAELETAGLVQKGRKGGHYDRFRARIMFPVRDARGLIQGFGARALRADQRPKYLNSAEGELYRKSETLYGIDVARPAIAKARRAVVVEGYTDVLAAHQAGIKEVVAIMGTAITPGQLRRLLPHTDDVVLALDADRAGRAAMLRAQEVASGKGVRLRVAVMPEGKDPADLLTGEGAARERAAERLRNALAGAVDVPVFEARSVLEDADLRSAAGRDRALNDVLPVLASMGNSITQDELVREIANRLDVDPSLVALGARSASVAATSQETSGSKEKPQMPATDPGPVRAVRPGERRERALLAMCVAAPREGRGYLDLLTADHFASPAAARARDWLQAHLDEPMSGLPRDDDELITLVTQVVMEAEREPASRPAMELSYLQLEQGLVERRIAAAQKEGGDAPVDLQRRRAELREQIARSQPTPSKAARR